MNEIRDEVNALIEAVKQSETYREYDRQKNRVKAMPELKAQIDAYRTKNFELQNMEDNEGLQEKLEAFAEEYADFVEQPPVREFLNAEVALCAMMQEVTNRLIGSLEFE